jgi:hypothetical protein
MSDRSRSPRGAHVRTEADMSEADLRAALATAQAALATAQAALEAERVCRAADQEWAADRRRQWLDALRTTYRECSELAVLARRAGASGDLVEYWYTARTVVEPEPEAEPEPE